MRRGVIFSILLIIFISSISAAVMRDSSADDPSLGQQIIQFFSSLFGSGGCDYGCFVPNSLNDTTPEAIGSIGEKTLQQMLTDKGYHVNVSKDQTNIQIWKATKNIELKITYLDGISAYQHVFGYYTNGNVSNFVPLFKTGTFPPQTIPIVHKGESFNVTLNGGNNISFAIKVYSNSAFINTYKTENLLNQYGRDRALVIDLCDEFVVGFEDWTDFDFQDIVFSIKKTKCGVGEPFCGNGIVEVGEQCDDGNLINGDRCSNDCRINPYCGDGVVNQPSEECDDGNTHSGDGCSATCKEECIPKTPQEACDLQYGAGQWECGQAGDYCGNVVSCGTCSSWKDCIGGKCVPQHYCGDGHLDAGEECDDGNNNNYDGCSATCKLEECVHDNDCPDTFSNLSCYAGPSVKNVTTDYSCSLGECVPHVTQKLTSCGNSSSEIKCEGKNIINVTKIPGCSNAECFFSYINQTIAYCELGCANGMCIEPRCGDGHLDIGEECDDGNNNNYDGCSATCDIESQCFYSCFAPNSLNDTTPETIFSSGEKTLQQMLIDKGYSVNVTQDQTNIQRWESDQQVELKITYFDGVSAYQHVFGYYTNSNISTFVPLFKTGNFSSEPVPIVHKGESFNVTINGGNIGFAIRVYSNSGFVNTYKTENSLNQYGRDRALVFDLCDEFVVGFEDWTDFDFQDIVFSIKKTKCGGELPVCGNGVREGNEECDDGNNIDDDTCTNDCIIPPYCGDGIINQDWEECDDGNIHSGDGCDAECFIENKTCEHDVGVRYSYGQSIGTGIGIKYRNNSTFIMDDPAQLIFGQNYTVKYYIDNKIENTTNNIHVILKINNTVIADYNSGINDYHPGSVDLNTSLFDAGNYKISLDISKINETDCNLSDNHAERDILIIKKEIVCGNGIVEIGEQCDDGNLINGDGCNSNCEYEIRCYNNSQCGTDFYSNNFCIGDSVAKNKTIFTCHYPGQANSYCSNSTLTNVTQECAYGCDDGYCEECVPKTCEQLGKICGSWGDSCGGTLNCGPTTLNCSLQFGTCNVNGIKTCNLLGIDYGSCNAVDPRPGNCIGKECGSDLCGGSCGSCQLNETCQQNTCIPNAYCGDGHLDIGEECDDGNNNDTDSCSNSCTINHGCIPKDEICNGIDDNCNGQIDEGISNQTSGSDVGECRKEIRSCISGHFVVVQTGIEPHTEICDQKDNDCDGRIDEGDVCGDCSRLDSDNDGVNNCNDLCPNSKPGEPVDEDGCDIFQFCSEFSCGMDCVTADWRDNENDFYPKDCKVVLVSNEGQLYPKCVPTEFSNMCAG